jgi:LmbE family N-acetylglucosaminyl deacetylase
LDFPAPRLDVVANHELADSIRAIIHATRPSIVYLPHHGDLHADHRAVHRATLVAARPLSACPVLRLLCYECPSETEWGSPEDCFIPTVFVDISEYLQSKQKALACYQSQLKAPPHSRSLQTIEHLARLRGSTISVDAAEAFVLVREILK